MIKVAVQDKTNKEKSIRKTCQSEKKKEDAINVLDQNVTKKDKVMVCNAEDEHA